MKEPEPFNLTLAQDGEPIMLRDGRPAEFVTFEPRAKNHKVVVLIDGQIHTRFLNGMLWPDGVSNPKDIVMAPKKNIVWLKLLRVGYHLEAHVGKGPGNEWTHTKLIKEFPVEVDA